MRIATVLLLSLFALVALGQNNPSSTLSGLTITSFTPVNNAVNVSASTTTVSIVFSAPLDTTSFMTGGKGGPGGGVITNIDSLKGVSFSADHTTLYLSVKVSPGKTYFVCVYYAKSATGGLTLSIPAVTRFTTGASFPAYSVSGTVSAGATGISPAYALVVLSKTPIGGSQTDDFRAGGVADAFGNFTIPYVANDTLYSIAAEDVNNDGEIDPGLGDVVGVGPQVIIYNANVTGVNITFMGVGQFSYKSALDSLAAHTAQLPVTRQLRRVLSSGTDSTGAARNWQFYYTSTSRATSVTLRVDMFSTTVSPMDSNDYQWSQAWRPIASLPSVTAVDTFMARAERNGGHAYRPVPMTWNNFEVQVSIGDLRYSDMWDMVSDTSKNYLGVSYQYFMQNGNQWTTLYRRRFLGDYATGSILGTTGVQEQASGFVPGSYMLEQNYPNPFNPSTTIQFTLVNPQFITVKIFDVLGREVATLVNEAKAAGRYSVQWNAEGVPSGTYFCRLQSPGSMETRKMMLLK